MCDGWCKDCPSEAQCVAANEEASMATQLGVDRRSLYDMFGMEVFHTIFAPLGPVKRFIMRHWLTIRRKICG